MAARRRPRTTAWRVALLRHARADLAIRGTQSAVLTLRRHPRVARRRQLRASGG
ncbi:MAG: hypothetical protein IPJ11_09710 [Gemmatimonadetes bacterium]|nr:hypothetical protein [Gemmatimonadota bacterium]